MKRRMKSIIGLIVSMAIIIASVPMGALAINDVSGTEMSDIIVKVGDKSSKVYKLDYKGLENYFIEVYYTEANRESISVIADDDENEYEKANYLQKSSDIPTALSYSIEGDDIPTYDDILKNFTTVDFNGEYGSISVFNGVLLVHWVDSETEIAEAKESNPNANGEATDIKGIITSDLTASENGTNLDVWDLDNSEIEASLNLATYYTEAKKEPAIQSNDFLNENMESQFNISKNVEYNVQKPDEIINGLTQEITYKAILSECIDVDPDGEYWATVLYKLNDDEMDAMGLLIIRWLANNEEQPTITSKIENCELSQGQWVFEKDLYDKKKAYIALPYGVDNTVLKISADDKTETVRLNGNDVAKNSDGTYSLELSSNMENLGFTNNLVLADGSENTAIYEIVCRTAKWDSLPDKVVDYICPDSQYTNGKGSSTYGIRGVGTLLGSTGTVSIFDCLGPASLGNFGGYITYYYENAIKDNPNNPYGIDFITFGNSFEGSTEFAEPGQVWVSEDGKKWYAIAGAAHYDDDTDWNASITYKKSEATEVYPFVDKSYYPLHEFSESEDEEITLTGINIGTMDGINEYGNSRPKFPAFGYTDVGRRAKYLPSNEEDINGMNVADNPYLGFHAKDGWPGRLFLDATDGIDLAWAVDENGQPAKLKNGIHYIKIQTASNIKNAAINEKSTEVNMVMVAAADEKEVGKTANPTSIFIDGKKIEIKDGYYVYNDILVDGPFLVSVDTAKNNNVFVNGKRGQNIIFDKKPEKNIVRVIVQEEKKEPIIYIFNVKEKTESKEASAILTLDAKGGKVDSADKITLKFDEHMSEIKLPLPSNDNDNVEFAGWYSFGQDGQKKYETYPSKVIDTTLYAKWKTKENYVPEPEKNINVTFRLIGATKSEKDIDLSNGETGYCGSEYVNWIRTKSYTLPEGSTVADLFIMATQDAGIRSKGASSGYVSTIYAPDSYGGYELSEFTNGLYSGWMYTMNGKHTDGINVQKLTDGAEVVWHYIQDYRWEVEDWFDEPNWPSLAKIHGVTRYFNLWLNAPDIAPPASAVEANSVGVITSKVGELDVTVAKTEIVKDKEKNPDGTNTTITTVTVKGENATEMVKQAKENKSSEIVLDAKAEEADADKVKVELPKKVADNILNDTMADLTVKIPEAEVKISRSALKEIASQAKSDKLTIEVEKVKNPTEEQKKSAGKSAEVFALTVKSGDTVIHSFGAGKVSVRKLIPERLKDKKVAAIYIPEKGDIEVMSGKRVKVDKKSFYEFSTSHFSDFALVDAEELGIEVEETVTADEVKAIVKDLKLKAATKALKKSIRVTVKVDKETLMNLKESGCELKYKYYRAARKNGRYKLTATEKSNRYVDTKAAKGKTYYYKVRLAVYDGEGRLIAATSLKNCNASKRQIKKTA